jgi:hypothetical protein
MGSEIPLRETSRPADPATPAALAVSSVARIWPPSASAPTRAAWWTPLPP